MPDLNKVKTKVGDILSTSFNTVVGTALGTVALDSLGAKADFSNMAQSADEVTGSIQPIAEVAANVLNNHPNSVASFIGLTAIAMAVNNRRRHLPSLSLRRKSSPNSLAQKSAKLPKMKTGKITDTDVRQIGDTMGDTPPETGLSNTDKASLIDLVMDGSYAQHADQVESLRGDFTNPDRANPPVA